MNDLVKLLKEQIIKEVSGLQEVAEDFGQMDSISNVKDVKLPCVLIDLQTGQCRDEGMLRQQIKFWLNIKLYAAKPISSTNENDDTDFWELYTSLNQSLHGRNFLAEGYGLPIRQNLDRIKRNDGIYECDTYYTIVYTDVSCIPQYQFIKAQAKIDVK